MADPITPDLQGDASTPEPIRIDPRAPTIRRLARRLQEADGPSPELDREIMALTYRWESRHIGATCWPECCPGSQHLDHVWIDPLSDRWVTNAINGLAVTSSLDEALRFAERILGMPHIIMGGGQTGETRPWARVGRMVRNHGADATGATMAMALCAAVLIEGSELS